MSFSNLYHKMILPLRQVIKITFFIYNLTARLPEEIWERAKKKSKQQQCTLETISALVTRCPWVMKASVKIADDIYKNSGSHSNGRGNTAHCVVVKGALSGIPLQLCSQHRTKLSRVLWVDFCCRQVFPDVLSESSWRITKKRWRLQQTARLLEMTSRPRAVISPETSELESVQQQSVCLHRAF